MLYYVKIFVGEYMKTYEAKIKNMKKVIIATLSTLTATTIALLGGIGYEIQQNNTTINKPDSKLVANNNDINANKEIAVKENMEYQRLCKLRKSKLNTTVKSFKGVNYNVANKEDVLYLSKEFAIATEQYFKSCGASDWADPYSQRFWPIDIEYMVTAIAFMESSYRTDVINDQGCGGLTGINKEQILHTLDNQWLTERVWGDSVPEINCKPNEVDIFNGATAIEYTYYNIGYNLANRFKKNKKFVDVDGTKRSIWDKISYTDDMQLRLLIASHRFGLNNVVDSVFERNFDSNGKAIPLARYTHGPYVEGVLDQMVQLQLEYDENFAY